ncbi:hypothetical protein HID58_051199 [Brassica napus]|uniref:Tyrosine-protein kinase catalytic domain-containing protein n=1 Tax=Brassica napus TaxID=3708 RepID=A0ABQ8A8C7_BRANA|nr:hypothetical protein HID58_051199 [Brassica napus]
MAAALECWSSRAGAGDALDDDLVDQVLMRTHDRSESLITSPPETALNVEGSAPVLDQSSSAMQKRFQRLSRNVSGAIASLKNSLSLDSARDNNNQSGGGGGGGGGGPSPRADVGGGRKLLWATVVRNLAKMYPGSQLPEKLVSNLKKHYDSLPFSYSQAGFDMKEVFLHVKLIEQASGDDNPVFMIQEVSSEGARGSVLRLTFACNSSLSWSTMSGALDGASISCKKIQIFEKKGLTLGVVLLLDQSGQESLFKIRVENALKSVTRKPRPTSTSVKLPFGLCGCQEQNGGVGELGGVEEESIQHGNRLGVESMNSVIQLQVPLPSSSFAIIAGDPENTTETWMSNAYSFGMVLWEMVTGEAAYASCSPVQAAVGIAACGLRPEIPKECPQALRTLMINCWNNSPSKRPNFSDIHSSLLRAMSR